MNGREQKTYKSPLKKLVRFFERSRDQWKAKCLEAKATAKGLKHRVRYLEESKEEWKTKAKQLEQELARRSSQQNPPQGLEDEKKKPPDFPQSPLCLESFEQTLPYHTYSVGHIWLFITLVLSAVASFRGASRTIASVLSLIGPALPRPSWYAGRLWMLRIGYYKLTRPKTKASDWVWIVDHTVQLGVEKCLLILGVRLSDLSRTDLVLSHEDVEPIALFPVTSSNGDVVFQQLEETIDKTGLPREILGDRGSDLTAGIERFCHKHPQTCSIYDIKHKCAASLKHILQHDAHWQAFTQQAAQSKSQIQQTALAFLAPPNQRTKARYMNLGVLVRWGQRALGVLDRLEKRTDHRDSHEKLKAKLGWLSQFRDHLKEWEALLDVTITTECFVRTHGLCQGGEVELSKRLDHCIASPKVIQLREQLLAFVKNESLKAKPDERLLGSSEIIESVLGKLKRLEQNQAKSGFTALVLSVAAVVSETTREVVQKAMETVPTKKVLEWSRLHLGQSVQAKRKIALSNTKNTEQIWDQLFDEL